MTTNWVYASDTNSGDEKSLMDPTPNIEKSRIYFINWLLAGEMGDTGYIKRYILSVETWESAMCLVASRLSLTKEVTSSIRIATSPAVLRMAGVGCTTKELTWNRIAHMNLQLCLHACNIEKSNQQS